MPFKRTSAPAQIPARCGCMDKTHGHVVPCFRPRFGKDVECLHCQEGTTCTKEHFKKLGLCWHCKCELAKDIGGLEEHAPDCPMLPL